MEQDPANVDSAEEKTDRSRRLTPRDSFGLSSRGAHEEEDDDPPGFLLLGRATTSTNHPSSGAEFSAILWGEDSDEGSVTETPVQAQQAQSGTTDNEDVEGGAAALHRPVSSPCGSGGSHDDSGVSAPVPSTRWGDNDGGDGRDRGRGDRLATSSRSSSILLPAAAVGIGEDFVEEVKRFQDEQASSLQGLQQEEEEPHAATSWGSDDDEDDAFDFQPSGLSEPFRMGAAAARVAASTGARSAPLPMTATQALAAWGCDGEEGGYTGSDGDHFPPMVATLDDVNARPLSPGRHHRHHRGDSDVSDEVVVAPWMPYARGRSGLVNEPNLSWADESGGDEGDAGPQRSALFDEPNLSWADESGGDEDNTSPRRSDNLNRILMGGVHAPARNATLPRPVLDDVDIATDDGEISPRDGHHPAATYRGQASTPSTTAPSSWFSAFGKHFRRRSPAAGRGGGDDDDSGRYSWNFQLPTTSPSHGDPLLGRWSRPSTTAAPPRSTSRATTENSPMHEALTQGDAGERRSPALSPVRLRRLWFRRKRAEAVGPLRARGGKDGDRGDDGSGVRAWGWRDSLKDAPGLVGRLGVCILAVCALWLTSLSVVVDVTSGVIPSPTLTAVITAVAHAYFIVQEERGASEDCVARQSVYCDSDIEEFEATARIEIEESLASTAATFELASLWTESCQASVREVEVSIKTWLAQGTGHSLLYSSDNSSNSASTTTSTSNCSSTDRALVADFLGDAAPGRDDLASAATEFAAHSVGTVVALSSYARERSEYDVAYVANTTTEVAVDVLVRLENVTFEVPESIAESLAEISDLGGTLVSCVSLRGDGASGDAGQTCPVQSARELADEARAELDYQLEVARAGFQEYADTYEEYKSNAEQAYGNWMLFYEGVLVVLEGGGTPILNLGEWSKLNAADFLIESPQLPSASGVLSGIGEALAAAEIWDSVSGAYGNFSAGVASISGRVAADVDALGETWGSAVSEALSNISVSIAQQDYAPPLYGNSSTENGSSALLGSAGPEYTEAADGYRSSSLELLEGLGPAAANLSFPASPSLNSTLIVGNASTVIGTPVDYSFAAFTGATTSFDSWVVSLGNLALLLLLTDYVFRTTSSLRLFVRFWGRGGLGVPDADVRVDKASASAGGAVSGLRGGLVRVAIHPVTTMVFFGGVLSLVLYNLASLYAPLFADYRAGCVEKTQNGSFFSQNLYSVAYNYAADQGNREQWNYQEDHTSRRGALCVELTANVRQYLAETDAQLRVMYESHYDDVTAAATIGACVDTAGMDALYAEACCGYDGYTNGTCVATGANSTLQCPLNYASGVAEAFGPLDVPLSDTACSSETLDAAGWEIEDGIALDCDTIPACQMTCAGPNEELLRVVTVHAGCMVEWMFHAGAARLAASFLMFVFLNVSRVVLVGGFVKLNWRRLHPGIFTYKGTCTRAGELVVKNPEKKAEKSREGAAAAKAAAAAAAAAKESAQGGSKSPLARARSRLTTRAARKAAPSSRGGNKSTGNCSSSSSSHSKGGDHGDDGDVPPPDAPTKKKQPMTFKRIISGAVEEGLGIYESSARLQIVFGVLLNVPWLLVLWFGRGSNTAYVAD